MTVLMRIKKNIPRIISLFGIIGSVFYFLHIVFGRIFYENYNPFAQAVSDLTADNSPSRYIATIFTKLYGIFTVIFSIGFFVYFRDKMNKIVNYGSCGFCIMTIITFIGYTLFPLSDSGYAGTFQDKMHVLVTILVVVSTIVSLILFITGFIKSKLYKYMGIVSLCTLILLFTGTMLINIVPKEYFGIAERINVYSVVIYTGVLSIWMYILMGVQNEKNF
jgi:hypothetical membrane protein